MEQLVLGTKAAGASVEQVKGVDVNLPDMTDEKRWSIGVLQQGRLPINPGIALLYDIGWIEEYTGELSHHCPRSSPEDTEGAAIVVHAGTHWPVVAGTAILKEESLTCTR